MSARTRRPSLLSGLLWTALGVLFLLHTLGLGIDLPQFAARYWPILLILFGLGKVMDHYLKKDGASLRFGEVFLILLIVVAGLTVTRIHNSRFGEVLRDLPIQLGDVSVRPGQWLGTSFTYTEEAAYPATPSTPLLIENSYGLVSLLPGSSQEIRIRLRKTVYESSEPRAKEIAGRIRIETAAEGETEASAFLIRTNRADLSASDYRFNTDMEIFVPNKSRIQVRNSFGEVKAANLEGAFDLSTSHRGLEVRDCSGSFVASNNFAESRLVNLTGNVTVRARGRVSIETIKGDVEVHDENSPVEITNVDGQVTVSNTESRITLDTISGAVAVEARGTQLTIRNLSDSLKAAASYGTVRISGVASKVFLDTSYATVSLKDIGGDVDISSDSDRINAEDMLGRFKAAAKRTGIRLSSVRGPVDIETTLKDVIVNDFTGSCSVANEYADVSLSPAILAKGGITVRNRSGDIGVFLPENASFQIEATAHNGNVHALYPGLGVTKGSGEASTLVGKLGTGESRVALETEYGNIQIRTRGSGNRDAAEASEGETKKQPRRRDRNVEAVR